MCTGRCTVCNLALRTVLPDQLSTCLHCMTYAMSKPFAPSCIMMAWSFHHGGAAPDAASDVADSHQDSTTQASNDSLCPTLNLAKLLIVAVRKASCLIVFQQMDLSLRGS